MTKSIKKYCINIGIPLIVVIGIVVAAWFVHHKAKNDTDSLTQTYCSSIGKVCISHPKNWQVSTNANGQASFTDKTSGTTVQYSPQLISASDPCGPGDCLFKTLSAVISSGFSNANDVSGVFQQGNKTYIPQYFLVATTQLLNKGLGSVGTTVDIKATGLDLGFVNGSLSQYDQTLEVSPPNSTTFSTQAAAQNWLHSASAETAIAIVNSARPQ